MKDVKPAASERAIGRIVVRGSGRYRTIGAELEGPGWTDYPPPTQRAVRALLPPYRARGLGSYTLSSRYDIDLVNVPAAEAGRVADELHRLLTPTEAVWARFDRRMALEHGEEFWERWKSLWTRHAGKDPDEALG